MDKNAIKKFAVWARRELISRVSQKAVQYGITEESFGDSNADSVNGRVLTKAEKQQRQRLIQKIKAEGYRQVMEEVAYTWFNRFIALRFMEVNGYLPSRVRVFTDDQGAFKPQILTEAINLDLDGLDMERVYALKDANKTEELYKYLLIVQCNALNPILPGMFQRIEDYTELLFPDNLLREGSVIDRMVRQGESDSIPEADWTDQVQIIGWLYQYYNTEPKDQVFADLKKNIKITKEKIPAATQLFTPDWIVRYMVENSLGRLWVEGHPSAKEKFLPAHNEDGSVRKEEGKWNYYLEEAPQEPEVEAQLAEIRKEYAALTPEEIRVIDPCCGSGHILCYLFDVLEQIYEDYGYTSREAAVKIVENNLWGLDIDERAAQLSYFAVMMKARQYDRRFFTRKVQPHVYAIEESNGITSAPMHDMGLHLTQEEYSEAVRQALRLIEEMHDAKEFGSIITVTPCNWDLLRRFAVPRDRDGQLHLDIHGEIEASERLQGLINIGEALSQKYHAVVTNPPYMGAGSMGFKLTNYVKKNYPNSKSDMSTVCMEKTISMCNSHGYMAMINIPVWMFLTTYEKLRGKLLSDNTLINMVHPGRGIFGSDFGTTTFVFRKGNIRKYTGCYRRLFDEQVEVKSPEVREQQFFEGKGQSQSQQDEFSKIPGSPIAYWVSKSFAEMFTKPSIRDVAFAGIGMRTGDNDRFLRLWFEVDKNKFFTSCSSAEDVVEQHAKWVPYNKGGEFRRWYGNNEYVVNWENDGYEIKENTRRVYPQLGDNLGWKISNEKYYFKEGITWTVVSSKYTSFRRYYKGAIISNSGQSVIADDKELLDYLTGLLNTNIAKDVLAIISPTIGFESGYINKIPVIQSPKHIANINALVQDCITISKSDWDSFETSWDFKVHPLVRRASFSMAEMLEDAKHHIRDMNFIKEAFVNWSNECYLRFEQLKANEEELNRIFIDIYGLQGELTPEVDGKDVTVRKADLGRDIRSFISYAVGCMFGRYSIYKEGLIYAGGEWDYNQYENFAWAAEGKPDALQFHSGTHFIPDQDNIIPITDDEYFHDDIANRFMEFVSVVYGSDTLEENLRFIADALGGKGSPWDVIRNYFLNDFYADHLKVYQKRPIYWLFDSGKKNGFKCLIYMHRYQPDTLARIRTDYVHELQGRYRTAIADLECRMTSVSTAERVRLSKQLAKLQDQAEELRAYEEKIHHLADQMISIDLDDGVKVNYAKFQDVLAKIK